MGGQVVERPTAGHECDPGWTWTPIPPDSEIPADFAGQCYGNPPTTLTYPKGTVWECAVCGRRWISEGARYINEPRGCYWKPEGWFARWRRIRAAR